MSALAHDLVAALLAQSVYAAILFVVALVSSALLGHRMPHLRLVLWSLVLLRLVVPTGLFTPWSAGAWVETLGLRQEIEVGVAPEWLPLSPASERRLDAAEPASIMIAIVWLSGSIVSFARWRRQRMRHASALARSGEQRSGALYELAQEWRRRFGIRRPVRLVVTDHVRVPFTTGTLHPAVCVPAAMARRLDRRDLSVVVGHELAHVKRFDDLWLSLEALVRCLYFYHPVAWVASRRVAEIREQLTDELLLDDSILGRQYAAALLAAASFQQEALPVPALGARSGRVLERRLRRLVEYRGRRHKSIAIAAGVLVGVFLLPMALPASAPAPAGGFAHPLPGATITSPFGPRRIPFSTSIDVHQGIDLAAPRGTPVLAPARGTVIAATKRYAPSPTHGTVVILAHSDGMATFYSHLDAMTVDVGDTVERGATIGSVGSTGRVTGPHLHFEIRTEEGPVDPSTMIDDLL